MSLLSLEILMSYRTTSGGRVSSKMWVSRNVVVGCLVKCGWLGMSWYGYLAQMTKDDLNAIILYLRSLPPLPDK